MLLLNFSHPISDSQLAALAALTGEPPPTVVEVPTQLDLQQPMLSQIVALVDRAGLTPAQWQTESIVVNPPALNYAAVLLLAELHGRMGYFPTCLRLRPVAGSTPPRFAVAELLPLQQVRDEARQRR